MGFVFARSIQDTCVNADFRLLVKRLADKERPLLVLELPPSKLNCRLLQVLGSSALLPFRTTRLHPETHKDERVTA